MSSSIAPGQRARCLTTRPSRHWIISPSRGRLRPACRFTQLAARLAGSRAARRHAAPVLCWAMAAPAHRTERLLNLVICLLSTRSWLTKEQIRAAVPQYAECSTAEAFDRMFERDKEDLRELGVPLVTGSHSSWFEDETGYRIDRTTYALPDVEFTAEELAVLGLASRVWQQASLAGPAARALVKLKALGVDTDEESLVGVEP